MFWIGLVVGIVLPLSSRLSWVGILRNAVKPKRKGGKPKGGKG